MDTQDSARDMYTISQIDESVIVAPNASELSQC